MTGLVPKKNGGKIDMDAFYAKTAELEDNFKKQDNENANKIEEREVINTTPVKNKCYQHVVATKQVNTNEGTKYYTNKSNEYVGKFVEGLNYGERGYTSVFEKDGEKINIQHDENGNTVFIDATCQDSQKGGKKKKRKSLKKRKTKKNKKKKNRKTKSKK